MLRDPEPFDWYQRFTGLKDLLTPIIPPESKILNVGSGNSSNHSSQTLGLSEEMFDEGYQSITNIDISHVVTKAMNEKYKDKGPNFKCK
jgi:EEF1A lysine methyltransferase 4